eukprot:6812092-Prymnesium_polylepis.2
MSVGVGLGVGGGSVGRPGRRPKSSPRCARGGEGRPPVGREAEGRVGRSGTQIEKQTSHPPSPWLHVACVITPLL